MAKAYTETLLKGESLPNSTLQHYVILNVATETCGSGMETILTTCLDGPGRQQYQLTNTLQFTANSRGVLLLNKDQKPRQVLFE